MRNTLETRLGIFFALALFVAVLILEMVGAFDFFRRSFEVQANFRNVQELKTGDLVKMAGVVIGRVDDIRLVTTDLEANLAQVTMKIQEKYRPALTTESTAKIKATGLLGQNFVAIEAGPPGGEPIPPERKGAVLNTTEPADLNVLIEEARETLGKIGGAAEGLSPSNLSTLIGPLNDFLRQNSPVLTAIIGNMRTVSDNIVQGRGTVGKLIQDEAFYNAAYGAATNLQVAATDLKGLMEQADAMLAETRQIVSAINAGEGSIGRFAKDDTLFVQATNAMANLGEILNKINRGYGTVGKLVNDDSLYRNAKLSLQKIEKATEGLEDQGPLSVLGIAVSTLF